MTHTLAEQQHSDLLHCPRCHTALPVDAAFCGVCGERIKRVATKMHPVPSSAVGERYRFTSLVRRRSYVQLFLAHDIQTNRPVAIRDLDMSSLSKEQIEQAMIAVQQEYDLLRRQRIPDLMPVIDLRSQEEHIFVVSGWPFVQRAEQDNNKLKLQTLQDLLQSGVGLPDEQVALIWMYRICRTLDRLHSIEIVVGDLDPYTIVVGETGYDGLVALMLSWLPAGVRALVPASSTFSGAGHFRAPEALLQVAEPRSDLYSLGAILYLLLTGSAPEAPAQRMVRPLRSLREINPRVNSRTEAIVMRALSLDKEKRYQSAGEMAKALLEVCANQQLNAEEREEAAVVSQPADDAEEVTISIVPIQARLARWKLAQLTESQQDTTRQKDFTPDGVDDIHTDISAMKTTTSRALPEPLPRPGQSAKGGTTGLVQPKKEDALSPLQRFKQQLSGMLPALRPKRAATDIPGDTQATQAPAEEMSFLKRLQRFILGEQQRSTTAAALIETPLRVQPNQGYTLRIHLMGRDEPTMHAGAKKESLSSGLSAMVQGDMVHVEVRSALYQSYAYVVQRADVAVPGRGYAAEVVMPMQAFASGASGRRERLHIFFTDELRQPLYEKPFVVEVFVSPLVQSGREGYNVIPIPL